MPHGSATDPGVGYDINSGLGTNAAPLSTGTANHCAALTMPTITSQVLLLIATARMVWGAKQSAQANTALLSRGIVDDNGLDHWTITRSNASVSNGSGGYTIVDGFILQKSINFYGNGAKSIKQYFIEIASLDAISGVTLKGISL